MFSSFTHFLRRYASGALLCWVSLFASDEQTEVIILANSNDKESVALAEFYAEKRSLPRGNIIALPLPNNSTISWEEFSQKLYNPLQTRLLDGGWLNGSTGNVFDEMGREQKVVFEHKIKYIVICRGVPHRIANDPDRIPTVLPANLPAQFRTNQASVDSELALLPSSGVPAVGLVDNPFFNGKPLFYLDAQKVCGVSRLDGVTLQSAKNLVEDALYAEKHGLMGRGYVDLHQHIPAGDAWMSEAMQLLIQAGYDVSAEKSRALYPFYKRWDVPAFYFGWYSWNPAGVLLEPPSRFARGAIAFHLHSFSGAQLRNPQENWLAHLVEEGAAVTFGNVFEPYLSFTHQPQIFLRAILEGKEVGQAGMMAISHLSWQGILIGDPLYRPMKISLTEQLAQAAKDENFPYALVRKANLLVGQQQTAQAKELLYEYFYKHPHPAIALRLAQIHVDQSEFKNAAHYLEFLRQEKVVPVYAGLYLEAGELAISMKKMNLAMEIFEQLFKADFDSKLLYQSALQKIINVAEENGWTRQVGRWSKKLEKI